MVAFAGEQNGRRVKEILESAGAASCLLCRSADQVRRLVSQQLEIGMEHIEHRK